MLPSRVERDNLVYTSIGVIYYIVLLCTPFVPRRASSFVTISGHANWFSLVRHLGDQPRFPPRCPGMSVVLLLGKD